MCQLLLPLLIISHFKFPTARAAAVIGSAIGNLTRTIVQVTTAIDSTKVPAIEEIHGILQEIFCINFSGELDDEIPTLGSEGMNLIPRACPVGSLLSIFAGQLYLDILPVKFWQLIIVTSIL